MHDDPSQPPTTPTGPEPHTDAAEPASGDLRRLERDVNGLVARADQVDAELHAIDLTLVLLAFAFGALAGLVYLQAKELRALTG
jgi:hypothetical protein